MYGALDSSEDHSSAEAKASANTHKKSRPHRRIGFEEIDPQVLYSLLSEVSVLENAHDNNQPAEDLH